MPERPGKRIVSLHDVTTEVVVALGAADQLVGVGKSVGLTADVEKAVSGVPRLLNTEAVLTARADVLLGLEVVASDEPELVSALRTQGAEVYVPSPATFEDLYTLVREVGGRVGMANAATKLVSELRAEVDSLTAPRTTSPVRVFVYDCCEPVFTAGGGTVFNELITRAGGSNLFAELKADWATVSWEEILSRKPELIVITTYEQDGKDTTPAKRATLRGFPSLAKLPVVELPLGFALGGLRSVDGLRKLRAAIAELPRE
jgi:iron complex transport system substrate-binding protein